MRVEKIQNMLLVLGLALALSACARSNSDNKLVEIDTLSAREILLLAEEKRAKRNHKEALRLYGEVERLYPYSLDARDALIRHATLNLTNKKYAESRASAQRFLDFYPADKNADYAQYIYALSYYNQINEVGRDSGSMLRAHKNLSRVSALYPDSEYAASARAKVELVENYLAAKEMEVGRYYLKRKNFVGAAGRFRTVVERYEQSDQTPEALYRLVETYLSMGLDNEAQTAGAILGHNFQSSKFYAQSYALLMGNKLSPNAKDGNWLDAIHRQTVKGEWL